MKEIVSVEEYQTKHEQRCILIIVCLKNHNYSSTKLVEMLNFSSFYGGRCGGLNSTVILTSLYQAYMNYIDFLSFIF